jgi:hypothetical protein
METFLVLMISSLVTVISVDTVQKRRKFLKEIK